METKEVSFLSVMMFWGVNSAPPLMRDATLSVVYGWAAYVKAWRSHASIELVHRLYVGVLLSFVKVLLLAADS